MTMDSRLQEKSDRIRELMRMPLFFIIGMPRSGTTWLQRVLNRHPNICCRGESHFADILFNNLQKSLLDYNRQVRLQGGAVAHLREYGGHVDSLEYDADDRHLLLTQAIYLMFDKWVDSPSIRILGEKTPDNILSMNLLARLFPDAKFLHLIRDGRDAAVSAWYFYQSNLDPGLTITDTIETFVQSYLGQWIKGIQYAQSIGAGLQDRYAEVRYESLVAQPESTLAEVFDFLDVKHERDDVSACLNPERFEMLSGNRQPGKENRASFFRKGVCGDWINHLDQSTAQRAWQLAGAKLAALGYDRGPTELPGGLDDP